MSGAPPPAPRRRPTSGTGEYVAIAVASRDATVGARLRVVVTELAPPARVMRARGGTVVALRELDAPIDARALAETVRSRVAAAVGDPALSVGGRGPEKSAARAPLALLHGQQARPVGGASHREGAGTAVR